MSKAIINTLIILIPLLLNTQFSKGQCTIDKFSVNPKFGFYNLTSDDCGLAGGAEINTVYKGLLYSVDYFHYEGLKIVFSDSPVEYYNQVGLMIGKYYGEKLFRFQLQGGIAPTWGLRRTSLIHTGGLLSGDYYDSEKFFTAGLVLKIGLKINPFPFLGIGLDLQSNINSKKPTYMPMISLEIGRIRSKNDKP